MSSIHSTRRSASPVSIRFVAAQNAESEEWLRVWESTTAQGAWISLDLAFPRGASLRRARSHDN